MILSPDQQDSMPIAPRPAFFLLEAPLGLSINSGLCGRRNVGVERRMILDANYSSGEEKDIF